MQRLSLLRSDTPVQYELGASHDLRLPPSPPGKLLVRRYRNTIQNPYTVASAANASGSLQTVLSKVT